MSSLRYHFSFTTATTFAFHFSQTPLQCIKPLFALLDVPTLMREVRVPAAEQERGTGESSSTNKIKFKKSETVPFYQSTTFVSSQEQKPYGSKTCLTDELLSQVSQTVKDYE